MDNIFPFPQQADSVAAWRTFLADPTQDPAELLSYVYRLYDRERFLSARYHQILLAFAHLVDGYAPANDAAKANVLTQCVDCAQSVVVDGADYGRFLPCGHVMHSFCMATYCDPNEPNGTAPGCRRCGVRFFPALCRPQSQLQVAEVLSAVRVLEGSSLAKLRQDYIDNGITGTASSELERLLLQPEHDEKAIFQHAEAVIIAHKKFLRELATTVAETLIPTIMEPRPFPPLPEKRASAPGVPEPAFKKPFMPPTLEPDILPPVGTVIPKGTRFKNKSVMLTAFSSKCKQCKRSQEQGRSVIAAGDQGFACTICVFGLTSAAVCTFLEEASLATAEGGGSGIAAVDSMF